MNKIVSMLLGKKGRRWIVFGFLAAFFVILFIGYSQIQFKSALTKIFQDEQSYNAVLIQNLIKEHLDEASQNLQHAAAMITASGEGLSAAGESLSMINTAHADDFFSVSLLDYTGNVLVSSGLAEVSTNLFEYVAIEQSIDELGRKIFLSERIIADNGQPVLFMFIPFTPMPDQPDIFFIVGELNLKIFVDNQLDVIQGEKISFVVADYQGDIFTIVNREHQDFPEMEKGNIFVLPPECLGCHQPDSFNDIKEAVDSGKTIHSLFKAPDGQVMNRTVTTLNILNEQWIVSISQPYEIIQGQITRNFYNNIGAGIILLFGIFFGVFFAYRQRNRYLLEIQYRSLINNINVGIFRADAQGHILEMNEAMRSLLDLKPSADSTNLTIESLLRDPAGWQNILDSFSEKDIPMEDNYWLKRQGSDDFLALFLLRAVKDNDGSIVYIEGVVQDITDLKRAEEERMRISRLESIELLAGGIAHDFNNQLTAIVGNISLSRLEKDPKKQHEFLINAEKACYRAQGLTQQLLTFSRGGAPVKAPGSVEPLIRECADFVLRGSNCTIEYSFSPNLKLADIDSEQIRQVVQNLVINANQAMPGGGKISIRGVNETVKNLGPLAPGDYVKITVQDEGNGIPPEIIDHIFDPYFTTKETGSGLGLAVSYSVIKKHGGVLLVDSSLNTGTTFTLYLPSAGTDKDRKGDEDPVKIIRGAGRILVIDDDVNVGETLASFLAELGYEPRYVTSGKEAIRLLEENKLTFDLVVTDLTLPGGMGGVEIKDRIRRICPDMKIIVASGYANDPVLAKHGEYGFDGIMRKPFKITTVSEVIHRVLRG